MTLSAPVRICNRLPYSMTLVIIVLLTRCVPYSILRDPLSELRFDHPIHILFYRRRFHSRLASKIEFTKLRFDKSQHIMSGPNSYIYVVEEDVPRCVTIDAIGRCSMLHNLVKYYSNVKLRIYPCRDPHWVLSQISNVRIATTNTYTMDVEMATRVILRLLVDDANRINAPIS